MTRLQALTKEEPSVAQDISFDKLPEAVEELPEDVQAELVDVIQRRLAERGRQRVAAEVAQAEKQFAEGKCSPATPDDLMREIES